MFTLFWVYVGPSWDYVGTRLGFVELSWAYAGFCWVVFGLSWDYVASPGLLRAYVHFILGLCWTILGLCWDYVGVCWVVLGLCWPILGLCWAFLGSMLGHLGSVLAYLGDSWGYVAPSWDYVERRKDIKVQKLYENMFPSQFFTGLQCFLHIARFRSTSLETTKTTKFGSRAGKTHFLQQLDSV